MRAALFLLVIGCARPHREPATVQNAEAAQPPATASDLCNGLPTGDADDPGTVGAAEQCASYRDELLPDVAKQALDCMKSASWDICKLSPCTLAALETRPREPDAACADVARGCPTMTDLCATHIGAMNARGRQRFTTCLVEQCGTGIRNCLWDPMVTMCD